jgi:hypothetical protein
MALSLEVIRSTPFYEKRKPFGVVVEILDHVVPLAKENGLFLEFGVFKGDSIMKIADRMAARGISQKIYGFDSFRGLPEDWLDDNFFLKGVFDLGGQSPVLPRSYDGRIEIVNGLFDDTLPDFLDKHLDDVSFLHIDSDLYSSAKTIFLCLGDRIVDGTIVLFDELIGYHADSYVVKNGEFLAFKEFLESSGKKAKCLCHSVESVAFRIQT